MRSPNECGADKDGFRLCHVGTRSALLPERACYMRAIFALTPLVFILAACSTERMGGSSASVQRLNAVPDGAPTGTFIGPGVIGPVMKLKLDSDSAYIAEDIGPPDYWMMMEGNKVYPQPIRSPPQKGRWKWDRETGQLTLTPETPDSFRWRLEHLRFYRENPNRLGWGGGWLERKEEKVIGNR